MEAMGVVESKKGKEKENKEWDDAN